VPIEERDADARRKYLDAVQAATDAYLTTFAGNANPERVVFNPISAGATAPTAPPPSTH
jgi:hypothetical protein